MGWAVLFPRAMDAGKLVSNLKRYIDINDNNDYAARF